MSIKEIADKAGVSTATVSRVLNNPDYKCSSEEMRDKIWRIARELNYIPNEAARRLKLGRKNSEGKTYYMDILMTRIRTSQTDPFFDELLRIIEVQIHKHNGLLLSVWHQPLFSDDQRCRLENTGRIIEKMVGEREQKGDGLIIIGKCNEKVLDTLSHIYGSIVSVNRNSTNYKVDEVLCDGRRIALMAMEHLISLGHRRIVYAGDCTNESRYRGYQEALFNHHIDLDIHNVIECAHSEVAGYEVMDHLIQRDHRPTAIYCAADTIAIGMLKCLNKYRNRYYMPSIIASDDIEQTQYTSPMLTTVRLPKEEMGRFAVRLLLDRMEGGHNSVVRIELEGKLIMRESCSSVENANRLEYYL